MAWIIRDLQRFFSNLRDFRLSFHHPIAHGRDAFGKHHFTQLPDVTGSCGHFYPFQNHSKSQPPKKNIWTKPQHRVWTFHRQAQNSGPWKLHSPWLFNGGYFFSTETLSRSSWAEAADPPSRWLGQSSAGAFRSNHQIDKPKNRPTEEIIRLCGNFPSNFFPFQSDERLVKSANKNLPGDLLASIRKDWVRHHIHLLRFTMSISDDSLEYI